MAAKAKKKTVGNAKAVNKAATKKAKPVKKIAKASKPAKKAAIKKAASLKKKVVNVKVKAKAGAKPIVKPTVEPTVEKPGVKTATAIKWDNFLTPLDDRLIVEMTSSERMTAGGLYIPDTASDTSGNFKGKVLVAGRGHRDKFGKIKPMDVKAGDTVLFAEHSGSTMDLDGKQVRILRESEVLGIIS